MLPTKIEFKDVTKIFRARGEKVVAVQNYSMKVEIGDFVSIIGPSGCGKSTLIRMLSGIIKPDGGEIYIDGRKIDYKNKFPSIISRKIGFIFQEPNLLPWYTIYQNVSLPNKIMGKNTKEDAEYVDFLLNMAGLYNDKDKFPTEVSAGILKRAGVIRAMVYKPEILLMDEPFGALDDMMREALDIEILNIWEKFGTSVIFITHNVEEAVLLSSSVYVMGTKPGRLLKKVDIELPRPRELEMINTKQFSEYEENLTDLIGELELKNIK